MRRLVFVAMLAACKGSSVPSPPPGVTAAAITVTSSSFAANAAIPVDYTCDGRNVEPQLSWSSPPDTTKSIAIVVDDPDAPSGTFTHLVAYGIKPDARAIAEAADATSVGGTLGVNDFGNVGWGGPCPPKGSVHNYRFHVYAADAAVTLKASASRGDLDGALAGHVVGEGVLVGTFSH